MGPVGPAPGFAAECAGFRSPKMALGCDVFVLAGAGADFKRPNIARRSRVRAIDGLAVERFLDRDMGHGGGRRGAVPVFFARREAITSPGRISSIGPPSRCTRPQPAVTMST